MEHAPIQEMTLVRGARQLLTLRGPAGPRRGDALRDLGIIQDGALLIGNGRILETGASRRLENLGAARGAREINATDRVVMPGFVDAAAQPAFTPVLSEPESHALPGRRLEERARTTLGGIARHGTTTLSATVNHEPEIGGALRTMRIFSTVDSKLLDLVTAYYVAPFVPPDHAAFVATICGEVLPIVARRRLAPFVGVNCAALDLAAARRLLKSAQELGFRLTVHSGVCDAAARMAVEMRATSVALDSIEDEGISNLARSSTIPVLAPASVYHRRLERYPPARALVDAGAAVSLASGFGFELCPTYNMQMVISLACSEMGLSPAEAISAATINSAHALSCGDRCGSLELGKNADILVLNVEDYREIPHQFGINHVHTVLKNGEIIYREGEVTSWTRK